MWGHVGGTRTVYKLEEDWPLFWGFVTKVVSPIERPRGNCSSFMDSVVNYVYRWFDGSSERI